MRPQPSMARCIEARSVRSPSTTSAPSRRRASARSSSRRTKARTLCPLASRNSVRLRPMPPTAPAAPVTRIGLSCLWFAVMSLTLDYAQKTNWIGEAKDGMKRLAATARGGRSPTVVHAVVCRKGGGQPWSILALTYTRWKPDLRPDGERGGGGAADPNAAGAVRRCELDPVWWTPIERRIRCLTCPPKLDGFQLEEIASFCPLSCPIFMDQDQVEDFASVFSAATLTVRANSTGVRFPIEECGLSSLYSRRQAASFRRASTKSKNNSPLRHSSRNLPLKLSMKPFSIGRPGRMKSSFTPRRYAHWSMACEKNSVPLSTVISFGYPRLVPIESRTFDTTTPESLRPACIAKHSRVKTSTTFSVRK